jgi:ankyrin repeat protein
MDDARRALLDTLQLPDHNGFTVLHAAIRCGYQELAVELIRYGVFSGGVNTYGESPMYIAAMRNNEEVVELLLQDDTSSHRGAGNSNALHAAVRNGNAAIVQMIMRKRPAMAKEDNELEMSPVRLAVLTGKLEVLEVFLDHDLNLGYELNNSGIPLLSSAASRGNLQVGRQLLERIPDLPCWEKHTGFTSLHEAVLSEQLHFVEFIIKSPQLRFLINMRDENGKTALHYAVSMLRPDLVALLLSHVDIDTTIIDNIGASSSWELRYVFEHAKTINWVNTKLKLFSCTAVNCDINVFLFCLCN